MNSASDIHRMEKEQIPPFTSSQVSLHNSKQDCWLIIDGMVLDVTKFLEEHPGGEDILLEPAGKDATQKFKDIGHSKAAHILLQEYLIGYLQGYNRSGLKLPNSSGDADAASFSSSSKEPKTRGMKAFVIKEYPKSKLSTLIEFFVPLLVAISFFGYRYLTGAAQYLSS